MSQESLKPTEEDYSKLYDVLIEKNITSKEKAGAICYGLKHIAGSIEEVYTKVIPKLLDPENKNIDDLKDAFWDIREEFRHIQYHIDDAKFTEL